MITGFYKFYLEHDIAVLCVISAISECQRIRRARLVMDSSTTNSAVSPKNSVLGSCVMMTSFLRYTETGRRGIGDLYNLTVVPQNPSVLRFVEFQEF
jgi:hypothetical protein